MTLERALNGIILTLKGILEQLSGLFLDILTTIKCKFNHFSLHIDAAEQPDILCEYVNIGAILLDLSVKHSS